MSRYPIIETPEYFLKLPTQDRRAWKFEDAQRFCTWLREEIPQRLDYLNDFAKDNNIDLELSEKSLDALIDIALSSERFTQMHSDGKPVLSIYGTSLFTDIYLYLINNLIIKYVGLIEIEPYTIRKTDILQNMPTLKVCGKFTEYHIFHRVSMLALGIIRYSEPNSVFFREFETICLELERCLNRS